jgi:hypothetical protein
MRIAGTLGKTDSENIATHTEDGDGKVIGRICQWL